MQIFIWQRLFGTTALRECCGESSHYYFPILQLFYLFSPVFPFHSFHFNFSVRTIRSVRLAEASCCAINLTPTFILPVPFIYLMRPHIRVPILPPHTRVPILPLHSAVNICRFLALTAQEMNVCSVLLLPIPLKE